MRNGWDDVAVPPLFTGFQALHQTSSPCRNASLLSISQGSLHYGNAVSIVGNLIIHHRESVNLVNKGLRIFLLPEKDSLSVVVRYFRP